MIHPFKFWIALAVTYAVALLGFLTFIDLWHALPFGGAIKVFVVLWGVPSFIVLAVGAIYAWVFA